MRPFAGPTDVDLVASHLSIVAPLVLLVVGKLFDQSQSTRQNSLTWVWSAVLGLQMYFLGLFHCHSTWQCQDRLAMLTSYSITFLIALALHWFTSGGAVATDDNDDDSDVDESESENEDDDEDEGSSSSEQEDAVEDDEQSDAGSDSDSAEEQDGRGKDDEQVDDDGTEEVDAGGGSDSDSAEEQVDDDGKRG